MTSRVFVVFVILAIFVTFLTINYFEEANALQSKGTTSSKYGSATGGIVCGDRLCSETSEPDVKQMVQPKQSEKISNQKEKYAKTSVIQLNPTFESDKVAKSYVVKFSGGEFEKTLTLDSFSRVESGDQTHYIKSFYDLGFTTNFVLESLPSKDKLEFYQLVEAYLSPGKIPELFDVEIDILAGDGSKLITANYSKCEITGYTPHTQDFILFYQYSGQPQEEIRDLTTIYCAGVDLEVYHELEFSEGYQGITIPNDSERAQHYVVHFFGPDFDGLYTLSTFSKFSPSVDLIETPFDTITFPGNPLEQEPQFFLESIPSKDKGLLYKEFSKHVNPGPQPELFNVSIDMVTGDEKILQRWNYVDCKLTDYILYLQDSMLRFPFGNQPSPEIRDKSDISCLGINLEVPDDEELPKQPIRAAQSQLSTEITPDINNQAKSFILTVSGGELGQTYVDDSFQKVETIKRGRGPDMLTPLHHDKIYDVGFVIESIPTKDRMPLYEFLSDYVNPGKAPEPYDVSIDTVLDDGTILHRVKYTNCDAVDFSWYVQDANFFYQFSNAQQQEIRERYINYCEGIKIEFP
jgi:hypothetical protein